MMPLRRVTPNPCTVLSALRSTRHHVADRRVVWLRVLTCLSTPLTRSPVFTRAAVYGNVNGWHSTLRVVEPDAAVVTARYPPAYRRRTTQSSAKSALFSSKCGSRSPLGLRSFLNSFTGTKVIPEIRSTHSYICRYVYPCDAFCFNFCRDGKTHLLLHDPMRSIRGPLHRESGLRFSLG